MKRKKKNLQNEIDDAALIAAQLERFRPLLSDAEYAQAAEAVNQPLLPALRLNPLKGGANLAAELQTRYGWALHAIPFCPSGYRVESGSGPALSETLEYKNGAYYIQESSSMLPVQLFNFEDAGQPLIVLDLAASPGGKTTHLAARMADQGLILANDASQGRIQALKIVLQHWGATNTAITRFAGESFGRWFPETFDHVLLDAPCSMQGLRTAESHPPRPVTPSETRQLARRQAELLTSAIQAARSGGQIVYSTCTLAPEEDEAMVAGVLQKLAGTVMLEDAQAFLPTPAPGIAAGAVEADAAKMIRLWPHRYDTAGFFACLLRKTGPGAGTVQAAPAHSMEKAGFVEMAPAAQASLSARFEELFGYALSAYLQTKERTLVMRDEKVFLFPRLFLERFGTLPVQAVGMQLCTLNEAELLPTFEWCTRFGTQCATALLPLEGAALAQWQSGRDIPAPQTQKSVWLVTDPQGRMLGRGKVIQGMLKNLDYKRYL